MLLQGILNGEILLQINDVTELCINKGTTAVKSCYIKVHWQKLMQSEVAANKNHFRLLCKNLKPIKIFISRLFQKKHLHNEVREAIKRPGKGVIENNFRGTV